MSRHRFNFSHRFRYSPDDSTGGGGASIPTSAPVGTSLLDGGATAEQQQAAPAAQQQHQPAAQQQQQQAAPVTFDKLVGANGDFVENWQNYLPEEFRAEASLKNFKTLPGMIKSLVHAQKAVGADKVALPGNNATKEEIDAFFNKLGRPETPENYKFAKPEQLPEGVNWNEDGVKAFAAKAHELGLTQKQAADLINWHTGLQVQAVAGQAQAVAAEMEQTKTVLRQEWGNAFDQQLNLARRAADTYGITETLNNLGLGRNPEILKFMAKVGNTISEDRLKGGSSGAMIPADAKSQINTIQGNKEHPYWKNDHPGHKAAVEEMNRLYAQAYPDPKG